MSHGEAPSQKSGTERWGKSKKVRPAVPMLSHDNACAEEEGLVFVGRIRRFLKLGDDARIVEGKHARLEAQLLAKYCQRIGIAPREDGMHASPHRFYRAQAARISIRAVDHPLRVGLGCAYGRHAYRGSRVTLVKSRYV